MVYATQEAAQRAADLMNRSRGYPPACVFRIVGGGFTVLRTWEKPAPFSDRWGSYEPLAA